MTSRPNSARAAHRRSPNGLLLQFKEFRLSVALEKTQFGCFRQMLTIASSTRTERRHSFKRTTNTSQNEQNSFYLYANACNEVKLTRNSGLYALRSRQHDDALAYST